MLVLLLSQTVMKETL